jgi:hypothetical protein
MTLLLQCLRDFRTKSGDLDLLPTQASGDRLGVARVPSHGSEPTDASGAGPVAVKALAFAARPTDEPGPSHDGRDPYRRRDTLSANL